jgi:hypothetical protein
MNISIVKASAIGVFITFTAVFSAEGLHCIPWWSMKPTFAHPCWSTELSPHVLSATGPGTVSMLVLSLPISHVTQGPRQGW